jgi:hypothetical protein
VSHPFAGLVKSAPVAKPTRSASPEAQPEVLGWTKFLPPWSKPWDHSCDATRSYVYRGIVMKPVILALCVLFAFGGLHAQTSG